MENSSLKNLSAATSGKLEKLSKNIGIYIENRKIVLIKDGEKNLLEPFGKGIYIWPSLSPDGTKLLFTKGGKGTYISDLQGNILQEIGYANAPKWSTDGNWLVYMKDHDDGTDFTASDIFVYSVKDKKEYRITATDDRIEMYPSWNEEMTKIVFETTIGIIYIAEIEIK